MHIVSKFQFFIHIFAMVKLKKTNQELERGEKRGKWACFCNFFKVQFCLYVCLYLLFCLFVPLSVRVFTFLSQNNNSPLY